MSIDRRYRLLKSNIEVSDLVSTTGATIPPALLGTGTADSSKFLRGDSAWSNTLTAPLSAISALTLNGAAGAYTLNVVGNASSSNSYGLLVQAGTNSADLPVQITNKSGSAQFLLLFGDGHGTLGPSATSGMQWEAGGNFNFATPASGATITVNSAVNRNSILGTDGTTSWAIQTDSTPRGYVGTRNAVEFGITTSNSTRMIFGAAGGVTVPNPPSGTAFTVGSATSGTQNATIGLTNFGVGVIFLANQAEIFSTSTTSLNIGSAGAAPLNFYTSAANRFSIDASGNSNFSTTLSLTNKPVLYSNDATANTVGGKVSSQSGGTASGGNPGDIILIY